MNPAPDPPDDTPPAVDVGAAQAVAGLPGDPPRSAPRPAEAPAIAAAASAEAPPPEAPPAGAPRSATRRPRAAVRLPGSSALAGFSTAAIHAELERRRRRVEVLLGERERIRAEMVRLERLLGTLIPF